MKGDIIATKKIFIAADFERHHNVNLNAINTYIANNNVFGKKIGF